jgi:hypothetical protein
MIVWWIIFAIVAVIVLTVRFFIKENKSQRAPTISKARLRRLWIVDEDNAAVTVVPKHPMRRSVSLYDDEAE